jgi:hypothetical protein
MSYSELDAQELFFGLIDRLVDAERRAARASEQDDIIESKDARISDLEEALSHRSALPDELAKLRAKGFEIWAAANKVTNTLQLSGFDQANQYPHIVEAVRELKTALESTRDPFDNIPF